ncbi:kinase-like domain-containing protein [Parachaetomium inaequale]|uniref:Kinase-like domain-containing protein n=1 Tax=Parachaetomium inaequale TaxID=2588326 RepID=A0AAN6P7Y4_9PEZI|nr:kinase-like domain-containing protein [Parachaetomium inaequale]
MVSPRAAQPARLLRSCPSLFHQFLPLTNPPSQSRCFFCTPRQCQVPSTSMSSTAAPLSTTTSPQPLARGTQLTSPSGRCYTIDETIYQRSRGRLLCCLYRASHEKKQYLLKDMLPGDYEYILDLQRLVDGSAHVRTLVDTIPDCHMFVYPFLDTNLHQVQTTAIAPALKKIILRDALAGLADLHDKGIYHTDIKPANIMMDSFSKSDGAIGFTNVQITDLEDAVHTPADIFSFGITAIYVWMDRMVFFLDEANAAEDPSDMILKLHVSHFVNDLDDFGGFAEYHGGEQDPFVQRVIGLLGTLKKRAPFSRWHPVDPQFQDLVSKMTCLDPLRLITAREALQHPWFSE